MIHQGMESDTMIFCLVHVRLMQVCQLYKFATALLLT